MSGISGRIVYWVKLAIAIGVITAGLGAPQLAAAQGSQIKPRILLIFDTSSSMQWSIDSDANTNGDGSWDPWTNDRFCCPGKGNSRLYHAKEAIRQMVFATGDIDFALMKFAQDYERDNPNDYFDMNYYRDNQIKGAYDTLRYSAGRTGSSCWPEFSTYDPMVPGSAADWLCVEFPDASMPDNRGPIMMWMNHHEFSADSGSLQHPDSVPDGWSRAEAGFPAGQGTEQELRAEGFTPLDNSMMFAESYLSSAYAEDYAEDSAAAQCRPYSVILLTDGEETCGGTPTDAAEELHYLEHASGDKEVTIWVIGFAFTGDATTLNQIANTGGTQTARAATSSVELSGVLYDIVSSSRLVEVCNYLDDDCDGEIDEGFRGVDGRTYCNPYGLLGAPHPTTPDQIVCERPPEGRCDGVDDNCDGETDEPPDGQTSWPSDGPCGGCDSGPPNCTADPNEGRCNQGMKECFPGVGYQCVGSIGPMDEVCNGLDDDCDGDIDEGLMNDAVCGSCGDGRYYCVNGETRCCGEGSSSTVCAATRKPIPEECNGIDDDCDGDTDENLTRDCMDPAYADRDGIGICHGGFESCRAGLWGYGETEATWLEGVCGGQQLPETEVCDCLDNDCDGETDEALGAPVGDVCNACGVMVCQSCELVCSDSAQPETCNGLDDNCNGLTDEGLFQGCGGCSLGDSTADATGAYVDCLAAQAADAAVGPGEGECQEGVMWCDPAETDLLGDCEGSIGPRGELCDGRDNDCDAVTDEEDEIDNVNEQCATAVGICEDGWWRCVDTGSGVKGLACCNSVTAEGVCVAPRGPAVEVCNSLDDDCDGSTDEDVLTAGENCGNDMGICEFGKKVCRCDNAVPPNCGMECEGETTGIPEECNLLDDDCDGLTDEDIPLGEACTNAPGGTVAIGECGYGNLECRLGEMVCNGKVPALEICDGLDNNCDGLTDENLDVDCPEGSMCIEGECAKPCVGQEMACPSGMTCREVPDAQGKTNRICLTDVCESGSEVALPCVDNHYWCDEGETPLCKCSVVQKRCISICDDIKCPNGTTCVPRFGQCHTTGNCYADGCPDGEICTGNACVADPCAQAACGEEEYCNSAGLCVGSCMDRSCPAVCIDGMCADPCAAISCPVDQVCNPYTTLCEPVASCDGIVCDYFQVCRGGACVENPCWNIKCPNGFVCENGSCFAPGAVDGDADGDTDLSGDVDTDTDTDTDVDSDVNGDSEKQLDTENGIGMTNVLATGSGGCLCSSAPGAGGMSGSGMPALLVGLLLGLIRLASRRRKSVLMMLGLLVLPIVLMGCDTNPYKFDQSSLDTSRDSTSGNDIGDSDSTTVLLDAGSSDTGECNADAPDDDCDGVDDDCDGATDEGVDLLVNANHCGTCGNDCTDDYPGAFGLCKAGVCTRGDCEAFFRDLDGKQDNGCEDFCQPTAQLDTCNGIDNSDGKYKGVDDDCDGLTDEDIDLQNDLFNCGACGKVCDMSHASRSCVEGVCTLIECDENFYNMDDKLENGCEYACQRTGEQELCNNLDDNCDGETDEGNPEGGAACYPISEGCTRSESGEITCVPACRAGQEVCIGGTLSCQGAVTPLPAETCNNQDDNCDGRTDENLYQACHTRDYQLLGVCQNGLQTCARGDWGTCANEVVPTAERCDGLDNDCDGETDEGIDVTTTAPDISCKTSCGEALVGVRCTGRTGWVCAYNCAASADHGAGEVQCDEQGQVVSIETWCNGLDDDCDGQTDEGLLFGAQNCGACGNNCQDLLTAEPHVEMLTCSSGTCKVSKCEADYWDIGTPSNGEMDCEYHCAFQGAEGATCDGQDNDCDGTTDNGSATEEICDGLDNDCDGITDNNMTPPSLCNPSCPGESTHQEVCDSQDADPHWKCDYHCVDEGGLVDCGEDDYTIAAAETLCDGLDNNCDGTTDEGFTLWGNPATLGERCTNGGVGGCSTRGWAKCGTDKTGYVCCAASSGATCPDDQVIPQNPANAIKSETAQGGPDGIDNDCDGYADDGVTSSAETITVSGLSATSFEIFKYEASRWNATGADDGNSVACAQDAVLPWTEVSFEEARSACLRLNEYTDGSQPCSYSNPDGNPDTCWDLCSGSQWYYSCAYRNPVVASPYLYPYGASYNGAGCNGVDYDEGDLINSGEASQCVSPWGTGILDLSGNAEEWTLEERDVGTETLRVIRGGSYKTVANGLTCDFDFLAEAEDGIGTEQLGFRCCRGQAPMTTCQNGIESLTNYPYQFDVPGEPTRCRVDGWWSTTGNDEWEIGKTTQASIGTTSCVAGTNLNGTNTNGRDSYLYPPNLTLSACVGQGIAVTWNMYLDISTGDYLEVDVRTSTDGGAHWDSWARAGDQFIASSTSWATRHSRTITTSMVANLVYQIRFRFHAGDSSTSNYGAYLDNIQFSPI